MPKAQAILSLITLALAIVGMINTFAESWFFSSLFWNAAFMFAWAKIMLYQGQLRDG